ncbi:MAG: DUF1491 family protein [Xanthobacteraceae bacterium]|nr:DUF1491 family protein [Xanthobacteraceae bacterium]QYK45789.1 MAG: DUF1491 family protein [Xanthobacteraceae bacterium]HMN50987.1 DUF1491 family protein [Xanthobacteraceae bacterium]
MRLKSAIWVAAYVRRCNIEGAFAAVRRRGADEAGAIFVKIAKLDGSAALFGPAPQSAFESSRPNEHLFISSFDKGFVVEADVEKRIEREVGFDPDLWLVEVEDRAGRNFLNLAQA